jgi:predicted DCC family thiol-disulfide oxidoreductase YuxK
MLVFDGDCGFCTKCADAIEARIDPTAAVSVVPWQFLELNRYGLTEQDTTTAAYWVDERGRLYRGHLGIAHALQHARGSVTRAIGKVMAVPPVSWVAAGAYWLIARYRYKLPGSTPACRLPR